jgi:hypothetical protein
MHQYSYGKKILVAAAPIPVLVHVFALSPASASTVSFAGWSN